LRPAPRRLLLLLLHVALPISGIGRLGVGRVARGRFIGPAGVPRAVGGAGGPIRRVVLWLGCGPARLRGRLVGLLRARSAPRGGGDRKSTRLNSSHASISYAVS